MLTQELVAKALPPTLKSAATQQFVDMINNATTDPLIAEDIRNNFISYTSVLMDGRFKTEDYLSAVMYVSYKLMGNTNLDAYIKTFPQRYTTMTAAGRSSKDIAAYVATYAKGKLVNLILEQTLIPVHVLNQDIYQKAINVQADLMVNANSEKVRSDAANSLLTHLAKPKEVAPTVAINIENSGMGELETMLKELAQKQLDAINNGTTAKEIAAMKVIEHEPS